MATNKYAKESMLYGANENIPKNLRADNMVGDDLMNSVGLYLVYSHLFGIYC